MKVDVIGIGAAKSGSSWLSYLLEQHPEVNMSSRKEVAYFNEYHFHGEANEAAQFDLDYYHQFWNFQSGKKHVEFSPQYLFAKGTAEKIHSYNPHAKLLVALRDPVKRAHSHFKYDQGFNQLIAKDLSFKAALQKHDYLKVAGNYAAQLKPYFELFPREQIKVFILEHAIENPHETVQELYKFVGVDPGFCPDISAVNESKAIADNWKSKLVQIPSKIKQGLEKSSPVFRKVLSPLKKTPWYIQLVEKKTKMLESQTVPVEKGSVPSEVAKDLFHYYEKDVADLEELLGLELKTWKAYNF